MLNITFYINLAILSQIVPSEGQTYRKSWTNQ